MTASDDPGRPAAGSPADGPGRADDRRARRRRGRQEALRRRRRLVVIALTIAVAIAALLLIGASPGARQGSPQSRPRPVLARQDARRPPAPAGAPVVPAGSQVSPPGRQPQAPSPGSLPQTHVYPSGTDARFRSLMTSLWAGIVGDSVGPAMAAFFPKGAYLQLKAIYSASSDWTDRLVRDYRLDIAATHQLLGAHPADAQLVGVDVPGGYGHWVAPGVCYNSVGYYEMPNARVIYRESGGTRSFGIASMISWRGVWYVVHLGAILRSSDSGMVDEPASGRGASAYSATC